MVSTRMQAFYNPFIGFLPQIGLAAILFFGGRQVISGHLTVGQFSAFYAYLLMLISPTGTGYVNYVAVAAAQAAGVPLVVTIARLAAQHPPATASARTSSVGGRRAASS